VLRGDRDSEFTFFFFFFTLTSCKANDQKTLHLLTLDESFLVIRGSFCKDRFC
jgi:hypothetical protein